MTKRCAAELLGTFAIVFFGCGTAATVPGNHLAINAVFGLVVAAAIYALGHISAAHFNPAVSIGFAVAGRFPWREVPAYVAAQVLGALLGSALHLFLLGGMARAAAFGATIPALDSVRSLGVEIVITFFLMLVIIAVATDRRVHRAVPGLAIGMTVALCGLFAGPLTGSSMNPARTLAPALFAGSLPSLWLYVLGPVLGAGLAATVYEGIRGSGGVGDGNG